MKMYSDEDDVYGDDIEGVWEHSDPLPDKFHSFIKP